MSEEDIFDSLYNKMKNIHPNSRDYNKIKSVINNFHLIEVQITPNFIEERKNFLIKNFQADYMKDQEFQLHPTPSIDVLLLEVPQAIANVKPLRVSTKDLTADLPCYLVGYHQVDGILSENDYSLSPIGKDIEIEIGNIINVGKSIGVARIKNSNQGIINYIGSMNFGASGGPLLDQEGEVVGINFGYFADITSGSEVNPDSDYYDVIPENEMEENYKKYKNTNLAINIKHPFLSSFFIPKEVNNIILDDKPNKANKFLGKKRNNSLSTRNRNTSARKTKSSSNMKNTSNVMIKRTSSSSIL
jgi:hypothetical protein